MAANCVITTLCPATVSVVVRDEPVVLPVTAIVTGPPPVLLLPLVMLSHEADSVAVHAQPVVVVTRRLALPLAAPNERVAGETVKLHVAAFCVTVTVRPATVIVALREVVVVFAVAV